MLSSTRVLRGLILGALGGFLGWLIVEPIEWLTSDTQRVFTISAIVTLGAIIGCAIGLALGLGEGIASGTKTKFWRAVGLGALVGTAGGMVGLWMGQTLYSTMGGNPWGATSVFQFFWQILARSLGWALIGTGVGFSVGIPTQSPQKIRNGLIGGTIGGFLGGFAFQTLSQSRLPFTGENLRMLGFTSIGAAIGFFVSLVDEAMKQAWVRVLVGRNEGREHILEKAYNVLGRDELAEVPLFGDVSITRQHATIERVGSRHVLRDGGSPTGTLVNGQRVAEAVLRDGDRIQIGGLTILFHEKATASRLRRPVDVPRAPSIRPPAVPANVCQFCGQVKDPATGACACTVSPLPGAPVGAEGWPAAGDTFAGAAAPATEPPAPAYGYAAPAAEPVASARSEGSLRLVVTAGPYAGQSFPLAADAIAIGRDPSVEVAFPADATTSRRHAAITRENGSFVLRDLGSTNGSFVNGVRVSEHVLQPGDEVRIGANQMKVQS
jgi:pSer/pThr/pTyr-binding forkhead associated (FHA) protein